MDRVVVVSKSTRLEELTAMYLTEGAAGFVLESRGQSIVPYREEHAAYAAALALIRRQIPNDLAVASVSREELPNFLFRDSDLIVVCGPDGLFVNLAKFVRDQPVVTVNPDPRHVGGALMLFQPAMVGAVIAAVRAERQRVERLPFVRAAIDAETIVWGINDIFVGRRDHVSARYEIDFAGRREQHSSSGVIVSTGVGASGWISSIVAMAACRRQAGGRRTGAIAKTGELRAGVCRARALRLASDRRRTGDRPRCPGTAAAAPFADGRRRLRLFRRHRRAHRRLERRQHRQHHRRRPLHQSGGTVGRRPVRGAPWQYPAAHQISTP
jgi:hypothetical protein